MGRVQANAISQSFSMLVYALPLLFGYLADAKTGRFKLICYGVLVFGISHALMVGSSAKGLLESGSAKAPYLISVYMLAVGAGKLANHKLSLRVLLTYPSYVQAMCLTTSP